MDISRKSTATLIDELITTSMKCWHAQDELMSGKTDEEVVGHAKMAQRMNARRNLLIRAIDERLGELDLSPLEKSYV